MSAEYSAPQATVSKNNISFKANDKFALLLCFTTKVFWNIYTVIYYSKIILCFMGRIGGVDFAVYNNSFLKYYDYYYCSFKTIWAQKVWAKSYIITSFW